MSIHASSHRRLLAHRCLGAMSGTSQQCASKADVNYPPLTSVNSKPYALVCDVAEVEQRGSSDRVGMIG